MVLISIFFGIIRQEKPPSSRLENAIPIIKNNKKSNEQTNKQATLTDTIFFGMASAAWDHRSCRTRSMPTKDSISSESFEKKNKKTRTNRRNTFWLLFSFLPAILNRRSECRPHEIEKSAVACFHISFLFFLKIVTRTQDCSVLMFLPCPSLSLSPKPEVEPVFPRH